MDDLLWILGFVVVIIVLSYIEINAQQRRRERMMRDRLRELDQLYADRLLTEEEYRAKQKEWLDRL